MRIIKYLILGSLLFYGGNLEATNQTTAGRKRPKTTANATKTHVISGRVHKLSSTSPINTQTLNALVNPPQAQRTPSTFSNNTWLEMLRNSASYIPRGYEFGNAAGQLAAATIPSMDVIKTALSSASQEIPSTINNSSTVRNFYYGIIAGLPSSVIGTIGGEINMPGTPISLTDAQAIGASLIRDVTASNPQNRNVDFMSGFSQGVFGTAEIRFPTHPYQLGYVTSAITIEFLKRLLREYFGY